MKSKTSMWITPTILFGALVVPVRLAAQKQIHYTVIDIGTLPGGTFSKAIGINNKGEVVHGELLFRCVLALIQGAYHNVTFRVFVSFRQLNFELDVADS